MTDMITLEQIDEFMDMLTGGELPEGMIMPGQPQLTRDQAFSVVWFLQEQMHVLPDRYEMCGICKSLFDTHCDGYIIDGTDDPDEWHRELGVTREMFRDADGRMFCSCKCESTYWQEAKEVKDNLEDS